MVKLNGFDLLGKNPIHIIQTGNIISPLLEDIWSIGYINYNLYLNMINMTPKDFFEYIKKTDEYEKLSYEEQSKLIIYNLIIEDIEIRDIVQNALDFFMSEKVVYNDEYKMFFTFDGTRNEEDELIPTGVISYENYQIVCDVILQRNFINTEKKEEKPVMYKNEMARKLAERMAKANEENSKQNNIPLEKMISKFCVVNKSGINMLNVNQLTIYQFYNQWMEYDNIRQCDIQDMIYANSVSFNDSKSYDSQLWLK